MGSFMPFVIYFFLFSSLLSAASTTSENFIQCLTDNSYTSISSVVYSPVNTSYASVLQSNPKNLRFTSAARRPSFIVTPLTVSHIQATVICAKRQGFMLRFRSGGHDYEGQSSQAPQPFVMLDFSNLRHIDIDIKSNTAWAEAGASIGELYYHIGQSSKTLGFPAGRCITMGIGGHVAGGGVGYLIRKYGIAADNVLDIKFIDVNGKLHDRKSMGEDLFWALRGGGGNSFGVILAWKLKLVRVPPIVTIFQVRRTLEQDGTSIFYKWQNIAHKVPRDLFIDVLVGPVQGETKRTIQFSFESMFLGRIKELLPIMQKNFPELGLTAKDCTEMSWVNSTVFQAALSGPAEVLLNRSLPSVNYFKGTYDFVEEPLHMTSLEGLWKVMLEDETTAPQLGFEPFGGRMWEISESALPYPHRKGNLYGIRYIEYWTDDSETASNMETSKRVYDYMTPYVSKSPRRSYINCKDLVFGVNKNANTPYSEARGWAEHYFTDNFARLAMVKGKVDPGNYFWDVQSIPPYSPQHDVV